MSYRDVLSQYDSEFADAEEAGNSGPLPDGKYQVVVEAARIVESKDKHRPMLEWELLVVSGTCEGRREWLRQLLDNPKAYPFLKRNLGVCGVNIQRLSDLPDVLESLLNVAVEITIKTTLKDGQEYRNVYFDRQLGGMTAQADISDDVPF